MRWNLTEQMRCSFEIFLENKYDIIVSCTLLVAPSLAKDMMLIWQSLLKSHIVTAIYLLVMEEILFLCHGKVTHLTQQ